MTVLRCTAKLLKRLHQPAKPPEPPPQANPLGEWYADIDFWRRRPFVLLLNGATGIELLLHGDAAELRRLNERALLQFASLCEHFDVRGSGVDAELHGFDAGFTFAATRDRSLLGSMNERKLGAWMGFEHNGESLVESAAKEWSGLFKHRALGRNGRRSTDYPRLRFHRSPMTPVPESITAMVLRVSLQKKRGHGRCVVRDRIHAPLRTAGLGR